VQQLEGASQDFISLARGLVQLVPWRSIVAEVDELARAEVYLNAYVKGQSVFKIAFGKDGAEAGQPRLAIHYKYLIKPELEKKDPYVSFDGRRFALDPSTIVNTAYESMGPARPHAYR